ncbi:VCBS domain-containing protein [Dongia sp.]|uniref:VCBS domain-containing protein n=1 Tax=Dongia sp. TaxID=1977262 RepID=UPI0037539546
MANSKASISGTASKYVKENGALTATGTLTVSDKDPGEAQAIVVTNATTAYGSWSVDADGHWSYRLNDASPAIQALGAGDKLFDSFVVTSQDGSASKTVLIVINGTNDLASISGQSSGDVTETTTFSASGMLDVSDKDAGEAHTKAAAGSAGYGSWSVDAGGHWTYNLDSANAAVIALDGGQTLTDSFVVSSEDGSASKTVTITIHGDGGASFTGVTFVKAVKEDGVLTSTGTVTVVDKDPGQSHTAVVNNAAATYGTWSVDADGHWSYKLNNANAAVQALGVGDKLTDSFTIFSQDHSASKVISVTINGTNDLARIAGQNSGSAVNAGEPVHGTLTVTDRDAGEAHTKAASGLATYGSWSVDADGNWTYAVDAGNAAVANLGPTDTLTDSFTVKSLDGSDSETVTVTIHHQNGVPTIGGTTSGELAVHDGVFFGQMTISDPDPGQSSFQPDSVVGAHSAWQVLADGGWTYVPFNGDPVLVALGAGDTLVETFTAKSLDGSKTQEITVTLHGDNDLASLSGDKAGDATEDSGLAATGTLTVIDPDNGEAHTQTANDVAATYGKWSVDADGHWSYQVDDGNATVNALKTGGTLTDSFTVESLDGTAGQAVTVTIHGHNDAPVITTQAGGAVIDENLNSGLDLSNEVKVVDPDSTSFTFEVDGTAPAGLTLDPGGALHINLAGNYDYLASGETTHAVLQYKVSDGEADSNTLTFSVLVLGANDAASISGDVEGETTEDSGSAATGTLTVSDLDHDQSKTLAESGTSTYGSWSVDADGHWSYTADDSNAAVNGLKDGEKLTDSFTVKSKDGTASKIIQIAIHGHDDAASISGDKTGDVGLLPFTAGTLAVTDPDHDEAFAQATSGLGTYGSWAVDKNGNWTYAVDAGNPAVAGLGETDTLTDSFKVKSLDGSASQTVTVTIHHLNGVPTIGGTTTGELAVHEGVFFGQMTISDPDPGQSSFQADTFIGAHSAWQVLADGGWTYVPFSGDPVLVALGAGETLVETFTAKSLDGSTTQELTITLHGDNDLASISGDKTGDATEDSGAAATGTLTVIDPDNGEAHTQAANDVAATYGKWSVDADGNWSYAVDDGDATVNALKTGDTLTDTFTVESLDGTASRAVTVTIHGHNDAPVISTSLLAIRISEDIAGSDDLAASTSIVDPDSTSFTFAEEGTWPVGLSLDPDGTWHVNVAGNYDYLADGETVEFGLPYKVSDGEADSNIVTIRFAIGGINDLASITGDKTGAVTEDSGIAVTGTLTVTDLDHDQSQALAQSGTATYGSWSVDADGNWNYAVDDGNATVNALATGGTLTDSFVVKSLDGTAGQEVTVTIHGHNDAPALVGPTGKLFESINIGTFEDAANSFDLTKIGPTLRDPDNTSFTFVVEGTASAGLILDPDGLMHFDPGLSLDYLAAGEEAAFSLKYKVFDGEAYSNVVDVNVFVDGINDLAAISGDKAGEVTKDSSVAATGTLTVTDLDHDQSHAQAASGTATYGSWSVDADGHWSYTVDQTNPAVAILAKDATLSDSFVVKSLDGSASETVSITIDGNRVPFFFGVSTGDLTEDAAVKTASGTLIVIDPDLGDSGTKAESGSAKYGSWTVDADGFWSYTRNDFLLDVQALAAGATATDSFVVTSADGSAGQAVTITLHGVNDVPSVSGDIFGTVTEDGGSLSSVSGTLVVSDLDNGESGTQPNAAGTALHGSWSVDGAGHWTYVLNNADPDVQALGAGGTLADSFAVMTADGHGQQVKISIHGSDELLLAGRAGGSDLFFGEDDGDNVFQGGAGNDSFHVATTESLEVDGGGGFDTLFIDGAGLHLDLTAGIRVTGIEKIDLTGSGDNTLTLHASDVLGIGTLHHSDVDPGASPHPAGAGDALIVAGDAGDSLVFGDGWTEAGAGGSNGDGTTTLEGQLYQLYTQGQAVLAVDTDVAV